MADRHRATGWLGRRPTTPPPSSLAAGRPAARPTRSRRGGRPERAIALLLAGGIVAVCVAALGRPDGRTRVTVLDVGQGDAILVEGALGGRLLVDGGPDPGRLLVALDGRIPPWDRRLDVIVLTHPHEDHVAGLPRLLERYRVGRLFEPGMRGPGPGYAAWVDGLAALGTSAGRLAAGDRLELDTIGLRVLWPERGRVPVEPADTGRAINDVSIVLLGQIGQGRFLLTGDVEDDVDPTLLERGLPRADILKVAHHGSRTATTEGFLAAVRPSVAIVSAGLDNRYGHPALATIERLESTGASVFRTDLDGSVVATFDGRTWAITTERPRPVARVAAAGDAPAGRLGPLAFRCGIPPRLAASTPSDRAASEVAASAARPPTLGYQRADGPPRLRLDEPSDTSARSVAGALPVHYAPDVGRARARMAAGPGRRARRPITDLVRDPRRRSRPAGPGHDRCRAPPA
jgi:competence protein ComEC